MRPKDVANHEIFLRRQVRKHQRDFHVLIRVRNNCVFQIFFFEPQLIVLQAQTGHLGDQIIRLRDAFRWRVRPKVAIQGAQPERVYYRRWAKR